MNRINNNLTIMKKLSATLAALAIAVSALAVDIGKPAPDFTVTDINGQTVKLADYAGKILASGNNTMEALIKFGELPQLTELNEELNKAQSPE